MTDQEKKSINLIELKGVLGRDPEIKATRTGGHVANFSLATEESWKDKRTGEWQSVTQWHRCTTFVDEFVAVLERLRKGDTVWLQGMMTYRDWQDQSGNKRTAAEVVLKHWHGIEKRDRARGQDGTGRTDPRGGYGDGRGDDPRRQSAHDESKRHGYMPEPGDLDDEIPF